MREIAFVKQNKQKWVNYERIIFEKTVKNADELSHIYIDLLNDLSYAQTYYPESKTTQFLNQLSSQFYQKIYVSKKVEQNSIIHFFKTQVPLIAFEYRKYIYFAFALFLLFVGIGVISAKYDENFVRLILGDHYVNMTIENIEKGNPVAVYKGGESWSSSFGITINNLYVGVRCYIYGIFLGLGTFYIMLQNAIMLGSFQYFFYEKGVFMESVRGIWLHGSMEIFAIIIEIAAGFILGGSILFPKTFSRLQSFKIGFKKSFYLFLSTIPFTFAAGMIEGYVTRYALEMPNFLNYFIILSTLGFIMYYYLIYPIIKHKKNNNEKNIPTI